VFWSAKRLPWAWSLTYTVGMVEKGCTIINEVSSERHIARKLNFTAVVDEFVMQKKLDVKKFN